MKVDNPYESAVKQTTPLPAQASRTNGEGVVPNWVLLTTKGSQKAGFQQEEKISVHPIPSLASADAPASPTADAAGQRWAPAPVALLHYNQMQMHPDGDDTSSH